MIKDIENMQGFFVTVFFILAYVIVVAIGLNSSSPIASDVINTLGGVIGAIASFWFATRGRSTNGNGK